MTAAVIRIKARSGNPDSDYWQPKCAICGWSGATYPNRTIEGRRIASERAGEHHCPPAPSHVSD